MTAPKITYGQGHLDQCNHLTPTTYYTEAVNNMAGGDATPSTLSSDILQIAATFDGGAGVDEYCSYERDITNLSTTTFTKALFRYRTDQSSAGAHAGIQLDFTAGTQDLLDDAYSTTWVTSEIDVTTAKTIDKILFFADDDGTDGTFYVWYDFLMLYQNSFTFPHFRRVEITTANTVAELLVPGRVGGILQTLGAPCTLIKIIGEMESGETWGSLTGVSADASPETYGEYLYRVFHEAYNDPWQYLWTDLGNFKVVPVSLRVVQEEGDKVQRLYEATFREYRGSSAGSSDWSSIAQNTWLPRYGIE